MLGRLTRAIGKSGPEGIMSDQIDPETGCTLGEIGERGIVADVMVSSPNRNVASPRGASL